jgi:hypothetical protein
VVYFTTTNLKTAIVALAAFGSGCLLTQEFTNIAISHNNLEVLLFTFTLRSVTTLSNVKAVWGRRIKMVIQEQASMEHIQIFNPFHLDLLGFSPPKTIASVLEKASKLHRIMDSIQTDLAQVSTFLMCYSEWEEITDVVFPQKDKNELRSLMRGDHWPMILDNLREQEGLPRLEDEIGSIFDKQRALEESRRILTSSSNLLAIGDIRPEIRSGFETQFKKHPEIGTPFFIVMPQKLNDEEKLEYLKPLLSDIASDVTGLPKFTKVFNDTFGKFFRGGSQEQRSLFSVFNLFLVQSGKRKLEITKRCELPPEIQEEMVLILESKVIRLCRECGCTSNGLYCSTKCERARLIFQCSHCGKNKLVQEYHNILFCECGMPCAQRGHTTKTRILNPGELVVNTDHIPTWTNRCRAAATCGKSNESKKIFPSCTL